MMEKKKKKQIRKIQGVHDGEHKKKQQTTSKKKKKNSRDYSKRRKKLYDRRTIRRTQHLDQSIRVRNSPK